MPHCRHCGGKAGRMPTETHRANARAALSSTPITNKWFDLEELMPGMLDGKVALVTGGGGDIGRATALAMVREGARIAVADLAAAAAQDTVAQINAQGGQAITLMGDVTRS